MAAPIGGSVCVLPDRLHHSAWRCRRSLWSGAAAPADRSEPLRAVPGADGRTLIVQFRASSGPLRDRPHVASDTPARRGHGAGRRAAGPHDRRLARRTGPATGSPLGWFVALPSTCVPADAGTLRAGDGLVP